MIVLRQRSYSIFQELYHSGVKRVKKKYLGRIKRDIAEKAGQFSRDQIAKNIKLNRALENGSIEEISNPKLAKKIVRVAREKGDARVFDNNTYAYVTNSFPTNYNTIINQSNKPMYKKDYETGNYSRKARKVLKSMIDRKNVINLSGDYKDNVASLAHEVGHAMNNTGAAGRGKRKISRLSTINQYKKDTPKTIKERVNREITTYKEEKNAWDNGIKLLKENGASSKEIKIAKKNRDAALGTYKSGSLFDISEEVFKKYSPEGMNKYLGTRPNPVSEDKSNILKTLRIKFGNNIPDDEIVDLVNNMKTDRQLYRQQKLRKARRKDKSIMREIFGNW